MSDAGSTEVLQATIVACLMVSAVAFVTGYSDPGTSLADEAIADLLDVRARDYVETRFDWPQPRALCMGATRGEQWILDAAAGRPSSFKSGLDRQFPAGTQANLVLKNGHGKLVLHKDFDGYNHDGYAKTLTPAWDAVFAVPTLGVATGADRVEVLTGAVLHGDLQKPRGETIEYVVTFDTGVQRRVFAPTALVGDDAIAGRHFVHNLTGGGPGPTLAIVVDVDQARPVAQKLTDVIVTMSPAAPGEGARIPAGTVLTLRFPPHWREPDLSRAAPLWSGAVGGTNVTGHVLTLTLAEDVAGDATAVVRLFAPTLPALPFDVIAASTSAGGRAEFLVQYPTGLDRALPLTLHPHAPYPATLGAETLVGLALANGGNATRIRQVDVLIPGGYDRAEPARIFDGTRAPAPVGATGAGGTWTWVGDQHLRWTGTRSLAAGKSTEFLVSLRTTDDATQVTGVDASGPIETLLSFGNTFAHTATGWGQTPGWTRSLVGPDEADTEAADGYPFQAHGPEGSLLHTVDATVKLPLARPTGSTQYTVLPGTADLGGLRSALADASTRVQPRFAPLGTLVTIETDVANLLTTLTDRGVGEMTIRTELYAPPAQGCAPTMTWEREASTLPVAPMHHVASLDERGLGLPSLFALADDANAYKVDALGQTSWSQPASRPHGHTALATTAAPTPMVITGTYDGKIRGTDALSGLLLWEVSHAGGDHAAIEGIAVDPPRGRVVAWTASVLSVHDVAQGHEIVSHALGLLETIRQVAVDADGAVFALTDDALLRFDAQLAPQAPRPMPDAVGFSVGPSGVIVASGTTAHRYARADLAPVGEPIPLGGIARLTAAGDATGDGVPDLVVALSTLGVVVIDGVDAGARSLGVVDLPDVARLGMSIPVDVSAPRPSSGSISHENWFSHDDVQAYDDCPEMGLHDAYRATLACLVLRDPGELAPQPRLLEADHGRVVYSVQLGRLHKLTSWHADGRVLWSRDHLAHEEPTAAEITLLGGAPAIALATLDGKLTLHTDAGSPLWSASPTQSSGRFVVTLRVPQGGFYGAHVLLTRLQWVDAALGPQEAVLPEWFRVVDADGKPVNRPSYTLESTYLMADRPPGAGR